MKNWGLTILCLLIPFQLMAEPGASCKVGNEQLQSLLRKAIIKHSPWHGRGEIIVTNIKAPDFVTVPAGSLEKQRVTFSKHEDFLGFCTATISFGESKSIRVGMNANIQVKAAVPVAKKNLRRGAIIESEDIEIRNIDISRFPGVATKTEECEGMRVKTYIRKNAPVVLTKLDVPPLVMRGEPVVIEATGSNLVIMDKGIAMVDGRIDQRIPVKNTRSGRKIIATVVAPSKVRVEF